MTEASVRVAGLTKLDVQEVQREIQREGVEGVRFEEAPVPEGSHGEVALFTAIFVMGALSTLASYLLRKHDNQTFEDVIEIEHADGRRERRVIRWNSAKSEAPKADIIRQIQGTSF
jgi:hypothetical protein